MRSKTIHKRSTRRRSVNKRSTRRRSTRRRSVNKRSTRRRSVNKRSTRRRSVNKRRSTRRRRRSYTQKGGTYTDSEIKEQLDAERQLAKFWRLRAAGIIDDDAALEAELEAAVESGGGRVRPSKKVSFE